MKILPRLLSEPPVSQSGFAGGQRLARCSFLLMLMAIGGTAGAIAQDGIVAGIVVSESNLQPINGAQVVVEGTRTGQITDASGRFRIAGLTGSEVRLRVTMLGYAPVTQTVQVGQADLRFTLVQTALELDEVVVTGTPGGTARRAIGNAVARVDATALLAKAPVTNVSQLLNARSPGVVVQTQQGVAGGGARIQIRGRGSMQFVGDPLIYVDGVRVNNNFTSGPSTPEANAPTVLSRLDDINPNDIESIEIIKGPAAATLYGTEASAGVVQIITKQGQSGQTRFGIRVRQGANWLPNQREAVGLRWGIDPSTEQVIQFSPVDALRERGFDYFRTGHMQGYDLSVTGGSSGIQYYLSGSWDREEGIVPANVAEKLRARANLSFQPTSRLDVNARMGLTTGRTDTYHYLYYFVGRYATPATIQLQNGGFYGTPPDVQHRTQEIYQDMDHVMGSLQVNHRPTSWLSHRLTAGMDLTNEQDVWLVPFIPDEYAPYYAPAEQMGRKSVNDIDTRLSTLDYAATASLPIGRGIVSTSSGGLQYFRKLVGLNRLAGQQFPAPGVTSITGITGPRQVAEDVVENVTVGLFAQQEFGLRDRLFLTAALRLDDNSAFGAEFDPVMYPKVSGSWVVSEEPFWNVGWVDAFRLRGAFGESGQQPDAFAALRTYRPIPGWENRPAGSPRFIGNPHLGPERGRELELGFDGSFFAGRSRVDFTVYRRLTRDAIVARQVAPSSGYPGTQFVNAGEVASNGYELLLTGRPVETRNVAWELSFNFSRNFNEVVSIDIPGVDQIPVGWLPNYHRVGYPVASYFGKRLVHAELDATGRAINVLCDDGEGGQVSCTHAPAVFLGQNFPHTEGSLSSTLTLFDQLQLYALADFKLGRNYLSADKLFHCMLLRTHEINFHPERYDAMDIAACEVAGGLGLFDSPVIKSADFAKLREVSLNYTLPDAIAARLNASRATLMLAARNLYTWRRHDPFDNSDPEPFTAGNFGSSNHNQAVVPLPRQFVTTINLVF